MTNSFSKKPNIFLKLWISVKPAVPRFPALLALGIVIGVATALKNSLHSWFGTDENLMLKKWIEWLVCAGVWGMPLSVMAQLLLERRYGRRVQLAAQAAIFALSLLLLPLLFLPFDYGRLSLPVVGVTLALYATILFILICTQGSDIAVINFIVSAVIAMAFYVYAIVSLMVIYFVFGMLLIPEIFYDLRETIFNLQIYLPLCAVAPMIFIAFAARKREEISLSFAHQFIVRGILLPFVILSLVLLYLNLFKWLFTLTFDMTVKEIFLIISVVTSSYLLFYFASLPDESPIPVFFRRYGALFMLPLFAVQIAVFVIKINAEGYTPARVASLLYIIFSGISCALTFIKRGKYANVSILVFAALCILGSITLSTS